MKLIVDLEKKSLRILENERSIFRGEYGADKLELYINKTLENEYPTITALLSNSRKIGPYSTDSAYSSETIDGVAYTVASFTLSKENGFTLSEGKMQITIWMNSNGKKEAIGNVLLNVINTTAFDDGDIIISGDVEGTIVNYKVELENLGNQVNGFNGRLNIVETNKVDKTYVDTQDEAINQRLNQLSENTNLAINNLETNKADKTELNATNNRVNSVETNKLDKQTTFNTLYGIDNLGDQTNFELDNGVMISGTIPKRDNNGQLTVPLTPTGSKHATSKKYVDDKIASLVNSAPETLDTLGEIAKALDDNKDVVDMLKDAIDNKNETSYQSVVNGGTYPRLMKYDDETLYLFTDNAYSISKDGGKTWSERIIICSTEDGDIYVNGDSSLEHPVNDVANAFPILSPNNDGRIIVFYRATNRDNSYFSIRYRISDTTGNNFGKYKIVIENNTGLWEPFADKYPETGLYGVFYSKEFTKLGRQDICYRNFSIDAEGNLTLTSAERTLIYGNTKVNQDGVLNPNARCGMFSFTKLKSSNTSMWIWEDSVELTATKPRPMIIEYCYGKDKAVRKLFVPDENKSAGAPYITTLDDGRIVISFQTDQDYQGIQSSTTARNKQWVVYVSKREVNFGDDLTIDDFVKINYFPYGENEYGCWGSVQNIDGQLYGMASVGKNISTADREMYGNIIKKLDVENIEYTTSNNSGVSEEQVMEIVVNNAIKSSATHTPDDTTIPTTAMVQTMINESSSGSGGGSKFKLVCEYIVGPENEYDVYIENVVLKKNKLYCLMIKSNVNISLIFNSGTADDLSISYRDENGMFVYITYTFNDENSILISTQDVFYTGTKFEIYELGDIE